jgi:hypothetical protein
MSIVRSFSFCINKKFRRSLQDVCVKRGADAPLDHHLLVGKMRMKLRKVFTMKNPRVKYNVNFLKNKITKEQFNITLCCVQFELLPFLS